MTPKPPGDSTWAPNPVNVLESPKTIPQVVKFVEETKKATSDQGSGPTRRREPADEADALQSALNNNVEQEAAVAAASADRLAEEQNMTVQQQAVAAAQAALTSGTRSGMTEDPWSNFERSDEAAAGIAAAYVGDIAGFDAATQAEIAGILASAAAALAAAQRDNSSATLAELVDALAALAAEAAAATAVALGLTPMEVAEAAAMVAADSWWPTWLSTRKSDCLQEDTAATVGGTAAEQAEEAGTAAAAAAESCGLSAEQQIFWGADLFASSRIRLDQLEKETAVLVNQCQVSFLTVLGAAVLLVLCLLRVAVMHRHCSTLLSITVRQVHTPCARPANCCERGLDEETTAAVVAAAHGAAAGALSAAPGGVAAAAQASPLRLR
eukprot:Skav210193  [mRNA]  locus=scaffold6220:5136:14751:+ [translate_table: standard]